MNKTLKKILVFILSLVVIVLVVFLIELLLPGKHTSETEPSTPPASVSPSTAPTVTPPVSPSPPSSPSPSETDRAVVKTEETADGTIYTVTVPGGYLTYQVTVSHDAFGKGGFGADGMLFKSTEDGSEYVRFSFVKDAKAEELAPSFLNSVIDYKQFEQSGDNYIDGTKVSGQMVTANDGKTEVTAWLVDTDSGVLAVTASVSMANKTAQAAQVDKILSTLTIKE
jgi:hypothetical protein